MSRSQKRRSPQPRTEGFGNAQPGKLQADSRLMRLLEASLALPGPCFIPVPGTTKMLVRDDQWMISLAIRDRCRELGGEPRDHLERALMAMVPKGAA